MRAFFLLALAACMIAMLPSCAKNKVPGPDEVWVVERYANDTTVYKKTDRLADDRPGMILHGDGNLTDRKNSSWCGTDPIMYADYKGTWRVNGNGIYTIQSQFWGGGEEYRMQVIQVNGNEIITKRL